jgi:hypothetical protein
MQTSKDYPIVRITDLSKGGGDTVSVDWVVVAETVAGFAGAVTSVQLAVPLPLGSALALALTLPLGYASYGGAKRLGYSAALDTYPSALTVAWQLASGVTTWASKSIGVVTSRYRSWASAPSPINAQLEIWASSPTWSSTTPATSSHTRATSG